MGSMMSVAAPSPDPRVGLKAGLFDAGEAAWNMRLVSTTPPSEQFVGQHELRPRVPRQLRHPGQLQRLPDLGHLESERTRRSRTANYCPASQSDVSVYKNLLFVSAEGSDGPHRLRRRGREGHGEQGAHARRSHLRHHATSRIRSTSPTCRRAAARTRTRVLVDPKDPENVYVYVSGSAPVRSPSELPGCSSADPEQDPNSALFRIEVIKVPLAHPEQAAIVSSPRIFNDLAAPPHAR